MNTEYPLLGSLVTFLIVFLILSYGMGIVIGGITGKSDTGNKIVAAEFKFAKRVVRGMLKSLCGLLAKLFHKAHKKL